MVAVLLDRFKSNASLPLSSLLLAAELGRSSTDRFVFVWRTEELAFAEADMTECLLLVAVEALRLVAGSEGAMLSLDLENSASVGELRGGSKMLSFSIAFPRP